MSDNPAHQCDGFAEDLSKDIEVYIDIAEVNVQQHAADMDDIPDNMHVSSTSICLDDQCNKYLPGIKQEPADLSEISPELEELNEEHVDDNVVTNMCKEQRNKEHVNNSVIDNFCVEKIKVELVDEGVVNNVHSQLVDTDHLNGNVVNDMCVEKIKVDVLDEGIVNNEYSELGYTDHVDDICAHEIKAELLDECVVNTACTGEIKVELIDGYLVNTAYTGEIKVEYVETDLITDVRVQNELVNDTDTNVIADEMKVETMEEDIVCNVYSEQGNTEQETDNADTIVEDVVNNVVSCKICHSVWKNKRHLIGHMKVHSFRCNICSVKFDYEQNFKLHMEMHFQSGDTKLKNACDICHRFYSHRRYLDKHKQRCHGQFDVQCKYCKKHFSDSPSLSDHILACTQERRHGCNICERRFKRLYTLQAHKLSHTSNKSNRKYSCNICGELFGIVVSMYVHMRTHSNFTPYECQVCNERFAKRTSLKRHVRLAHHGPKTTKTQCSTCKRFVLKRNIITHMARHKCKLCNKIFKRSESLQLHMSSHTGERPFCCGVCQKSFATHGALLRHKDRHGVAVTCSICCKSLRCSEYLRTHMYSHRKDRRYMCIICKKRFISEDTRDIHMLTHAQYANKTDPTCKVCGKTFKYMSRLYEHATSHAVVNKLKSPYGCDQCSGRFKSFTQLQKHSEIHTNNQEYKCNTCEKIFATSKGLNAHKRMHIRRTENVECLVCSETFKFTSRLLRHMKTHL